jgi:nitrate reductase delta subunit
MCALASFASHCKPKVGQMPGSFGMMRGLPARPAGAALERVRDWTRARFMLTEDATIMVTEISCGLPGCPPLETHIVFWTALGRHHFKIFKPLAEVGQDDLPPAFMKSALLAADGADVECC